MDVVKKATRRAGRILLVLCTCLAVGAVVSPAAAWADTVELGPSDTSYVYLIAAAVVAVVVAVIAWIVLRRLRRDRRRDGATLEGATRDDGSSGGGSD